MIRKEFGALGLCLILVGPSFGQQVRQPVRIVYSPATRAPLQTVTQSIPTIPVQVQQSPVYVQPGVVYYSPVPATPCCEPCPCPPRCVDNCEGPRYHEKPWQCPPVVTCKPLDYEITPSTDPNCIDVPFYGKPKAFKHSVKVPSLYTECREVIRFKDVTIDFICCTITVCVPCEVCQEKSRRCKYDPKEVDIEAYRRRDGTIDVYALNVPGLPKKFILKMKISEPDFKLEFPTAPVPTYP